MSTNKISDTAFATVSLRALSNYEEFKEIQTGDIYAEIFIPDDKKTAFQDKTSRESIRKSLPPGLYEYVIARTKYFDKVFIESLTDNIDQIVFLGAGFDSRPYRFSHLINSVKIFELDAKPTQEYKISCLRKNEIRIHENIIFISANFEIDDFINMLEKNGYDKSKKTLFILEGVSFYLSDDAVKQVFSLINSNSASGSKLCFDFQTIHNKNDLIDTGLKDEIIKFGIRPDEINLFVNNYGFIIIEHVSSADMEKLFLILKDGTTFGKIAPIMNFLLIESR